MSAENRTFTVHVERDEDRVFVATVSELRDCFTHAKTMPELLIRSAVVDLLQRSQAWFGQIRVKGSHHVLEHHDEHGSWCPFTREKHFQSER